MTIEWNKTGVVVERVWQTMAGYYAACLLVNSTHRCGYVAVPADHPCNGLSENDDPVSVLDAPGGVTYTSEALSGVYLDNVWWIGFDCAHSWDTPIPQQTPEKRAKTTEYVIRWCEDMAGQLKTLDGKHKTEAGPETGTDPSA